MRTTGGGEQVNVTRGEVEHARGHQDQMVLFILHDIQIEDGPDGPVASGGNQKVLWKWSPSEQNLLPLSYQCTVAE